MAGTPPRSSDESRWAGCYKARTPAVETTATSINLPAFAAPEMDVPQKKGGGRVNNDRTPGVNLLSLHGLAKGPRVMMQGAE